MSKQFRSQVRIYLALILFLITVTANSDGVFAQIGNVWDLSADMSNAGNPGLWIDPGAAGGGSGRWEYLGNGTLFTQKVFSNPAMECNNELPTQGIGWTLPGGSYISLCRFNSANGSKTNFVQNDVGGHAPIGARWTTDHDGWFQIDYAGYNARKQSTCTPGECGRTTQLLFSAPGGIMANNIIVGGVHDGSANAFTDTQTVYLLNGENFTVEQLGVEFGGDWCGIAMTVTEFNPQADPPEFIQIDSGWTDDDPVDEHLDLASQVEQLPNPQDDPSILVSMGPRLVAGQGDAAANHTIIRVLNQYGVAELQFLAYPTFITGGVNVNAGQIFPPETSIVASPISSTLTREIRIFTQQGRLESIFGPDESLDVPFVVSVGDYLPAQPGDEIAIASQSQEVSNRDVFIYRGDGTLLKTLIDPSPSGLTDSLVMSTFDNAGSDELLLYYQAQKKAVLLNASTLAASQYDLAALPDNSGLYESAFSSDLFVGGRDNPQQSNLWRVDNVLATSSVDAGKNENCFWLATPGSHDPWSDSQYIKRGHFRHLRVDQPSPGYAAAAFDNHDYDYWTGGSFQTYIANTQADYFTSYPSIWEPTFTHRHHDFALPAAWTTTLDASTGLSKYRMLTKDNVPVDYGEGPTTFACLTYSFDLPAIDQLYVWPLRAYVRALAEKFRGPGGEPEQLIAISPNHEMEILPLAGVDSIGDYNPRMISGFYDYLLSRYETHSKINSRFATSFTGSNDFDPPRNQGRGAWDLYSTGNDFYKAWVNFNRRVIFRRLIQGFRECLWAGFGPEALTTHQIPASYAVGNPLDRTGDRITPIDWILSSGAGYGGTRYGLWYTNPTNWIQGALSSGQHMISVGEYNPASNDQAGATAQAQYLFDNGVNFVGVMDGNVTVTKNSYLALQNPNLPRPGTVGGIGQVRAIPNLYNIACVGTDDNRAGLLKSLNADGSWEGTVYVSPFHAHISITPIGSEEQDFHLTTSDYTSGPITGLMSGDQLEVKFRAKTADANGKFTLTVLHDGVELTRFRQIIDVGSDWGFYRYVVQLQSQMDGVTVLINSGEKNTPTEDAQDIEIEKFSLLLHKEQVARIEYGVTSGTPHTGAVTFDVLAMPNALNKNLTTQVIGGHGTVGPNGQFDLGSIVELIALPDPGYQVAWWSGTNNDSLKTTTNLITLASDAIVRVGFELIADTTDDGCVDIDDLGDMATDWLSSLENSDLIKDGSVDLFDFSLMNLNWQDCYFFWMLSADWSDAANPNGPWQYRSTTALLGTHQSAWLPGDLGANQPAWADGSGTVPGWYQSSGLGSWDVPEGRVACHSPAVIRWTSPIDGQIQISGGCWLTRDFGRTLQVKLKHNGSEFTSSVITRAQGDSDDPFDFSQMWAGSGALTRTVNMGDTIEFQTNANTGSNEDFLAVQMWIFYD